MMDDQALDRELRAAISRWHRARWIAMGVLLAVLGTAIGLGFYQLEREEARLSASCNFYRDIGVAPLPSAATSKTPIPSALGVRIVVDARASWIGQGCSGTLPPPSPALRHWAAYYHLPVI
jgi:hypothetical protein